MGKSLFIAEKPSVAREFANALKINTSSRDGYLESEDAIVTWCVGHLVTMSYPEVYDEKYKRWSFDTIPFLPDEFKYEVIDSSRKQYDIVSSLMKRADVDTIYVCTDSGREGEYIYRLVEQMSGVKGKERRRVWIDSQTEEEILRGIREAKDLKEYDSLSDAAYLRAKEDYLMGINFSRALTLKYGRSVKDYLQRDRAVISVGRVMTCVLGIVVNREREIRNFVKTPFYRVLGNFRLRDKTFSGEWKAVEGSPYFASPKLYKENGFKEEDSARQLIAHLQEEPVGDVAVESIERKKENRNPPLLYNLAELQNDCSKFFKISPDETLRIVQELYEKKMVTYPRTDARVLSTPVAKEIHKNIGGLRGYGPAAAFAAEILNKGSYKGIAKTRYVNDKQITDHYAVIPTGQGLSNLNSLPALSARVYEIIVRRFLSIFYPAAVYRKFALCVRVKEERFFSNFKVLEDEGYLKVAFSFKKDTVAARQEKGGQPAEGGETEIGCDEAFLNFLMTLKKGARVTPDSYEIKEGETSPPKRYTSGSIILTMENAGQFIEDEELRAQIKGSGIGTSATRAEILKKLVNIEYLALNQKTQILTPTLMGEMIYDVVNGSIRALLDPSLTASWEKGLTMVAAGDITSEEYMAKLTGFVGRRTEYVKHLNNQRSLYGQFNAAAENYRKQGNTSKA
ncbi:MAG: DNA topoisomerase [Lachnospiraceae bacterium]|nr:DNA topoisomerase [Butyrivibrio sp.]MCM1344951.1 DNA topoisomerase [Muribaculaceae bacterium]MCM1412109.1 DNA topoisomerase [Lachnospiraceae bacterium]